MTAAAPPEATAGEAEAAPESLVGPSIPADEAPTDTRVLALAAQPGERLFRVLEDPGPLRPLLAVLAVLPAVLAAPRCRLDRVDPGWGVAALRAVGGEEVADAGPAAWLTGRLLAWGGTDAPVAYFAVSWAGATLLVWAVWQLTAAAAGNRAAAFAAALAATNPVAAAAAAAGPPAVAGAAFAVVSAWLWVRAGADGGRTLAAFAGACGGGALLLAGPLAGLGPVVAVGASLLLKAAPGSGGNERRRDRWPATLGRAGLFAAGAAAIGVPALALGPGAAWGHVGLSPVGLLLTVGLALAGCGAAAAGARWVDAPARAAVLGFAAAAAAGAAEAWSDGAPTAAGVLNGLVAVTLAAAVALEGACRPAVNVRAVAALAVLPAAVLFARWVWTGETAPTVWRATFTAAAAAGLWGVWEVAAFRWPSAVRGRRLLIAAAVLVAAAGVGRSVRLAEPDAGRGVRRLIAAVADRPERDLYVLAAPPDQAAARFLFHAAAPGRRVFVLDLAGPQVADVLAAELATDDPPLIAVVGGRPAAQLDALRPAGAAPLVSAGALRGAGGRMKEVRLLVPPD